jgi:hypothetical protein
MRKFRLWLLLYIAFDFLILGTNAGFLPLTPMAAAQNKPQYPFVSGAPDCLLVPSGPFTGVADSIVYDNRNQGCTTWHLVYNSQGFSAENISFKSADDSGNGPGAFTNWGTSGGTLATGTTLPLTAITSGQATGYKYRPFVKISVTSVTGTGTIWPMLYGYRPGISDSSGAGIAAVQGAIAAGSPASGASPFQIGGMDPSGNVAPVRCSIASGTGSGCALATVNSVAATDGFSNGSTSMFAQGGSGGNTLALAATNLFNGTSWDRQRYCGTVAPAVINPSTATTTLLIAATAAKTNKVCGIEIASTGAQTVKIVVGTQTTTPCDTGAVTVSPTYQLAANQNLYIGGNFMTLFHGTTTNQQVCAVTSAAVSVFVAAHFEVD